MVGADDLNDIEVINMFNVNDRLLILTAENGFMTLEDGVLESWITPSSNILDDLVVYSGISLSNGNFVLGTISRGLYQLNTDGKIITNINQLSGLSNNTILSLHEDSYGNVWMGLDNGINVLNLSSPYRVYTDKQGILGTIYTSALVDNKLYLGTNQGLFYKEINSNEKFQFITGTEGQVWNIKFVRGTLFFGHDNGTFIIENDQARQISNEKGTWDIKEIEGDQNLLICGKYKGLSILEKNGNTWRLRNMDLTFLQDILNLYHQMNY